MKPAIVIDTNVLVSALQSRDGASFALLSRIDSGLFSVHVSVPLVFEYEDVLSRAELAIETDDRQAAIDYLCAVAERHEIYFLWRPVLRDPKDDMVLELAVTARCTHIVTFNLRDFAGLERFGVQAVRPNVFLRQTGLLP